MISSLLCYTKFIICNQGLLRIYHYPVGPEYFSFGYYVSFVYYLPFRRKPGFNIRKFYLFQNNFLQALSV